MASRLEGIDFWRGIVLSAIFVNHMPGNVYEYVTPKNFGFSDSAEAFVFLSGVSLALAYGKAIARGQVSRVVSAAGRRAALLYGTHVGLTLAAIAIYCLAVAVSGIGEILQVHGRDLFVDDPFAALVGLFSLGHQIGYFNILPLYILLLALVPPMLWIGHRHPGVMLALSVSLYGLARLFGWNVPTWPMKGTWFFDPFAWQLIMVIGIWVGLRLKKGPLPRSAMLVALASGPALFGLVAVTKGFGFSPELWEWTRSWGDIDKTVLGLGRLVHFLSVAYLVYALNLTRWLRPVAPYAMLCRLGRHSLWIFAALSLLAAIGQLVSDPFGHSFLIDTVTVGTGLIALNGLAALLEARRVSQATALETLALASPQR